MIIEFNENKYSSVKSIAVKSETNIKRTSNVWKTFNVCETFAKEFYLFAGRTILLSSLTDTDSTSIQFIFASDLASSYPECNVRDILFEIFSTLFT